MAPPPRAPPALMDELVEEILLRLPPADPATLLRAAFVCKPWCRLIADPAFGRRFLRFHRDPPILGSLLDVGARTRFVPASSLRPPRGNHCFWRTVDSRHGRVLLHTVGRKLGEPLGDLFAVWDPITGGWEVLPSLWEYLNGLSWSAAVLCAGVDGCQHLDCHRGRFQVVIVCSDGDWMRARVYSSESGAWRQPASSQLQHHEAQFDAAQPSALVENALYFVSGTGRDLVKYNLASQEMSVVDLPPALYGRGIVLTATENGQLGFAVAEDSKIYLWSRDAGTDGDAWWAQSRVIELEKMLHIDALSTKLDVVAFVDGVGVCLARMDDGLFNIDFKSSRVKKVCNISGSSSIFPYMSFCMPALGVAFTGEGPRVATPSA